MLRIHRSNEQVKDLGKVYEAILTKLEERLARAKIIFSKVYSGEPDSPVGDLDAGYIKSQETRLKTETLANLEKAKKGDLHAANEASRILTKFEHEFKSLALQSSFKAIEFSIKTGLLDKLKNTIEGFESIKKDQIIETGATKTAYDKLKELYSYFTNEENLLDYYVNDVTKTTADTKAKEIDGAITTALALLTDSERIQISASFLNDHLKKSGLTNLDEATNAYVDSQTETALANLMSVVSKELTTYLTNLKNLISGLLNGNTERNRKGIKSGDVYKNYGDIDGFVPILEKQIQKLSTLLETDWKDTTKTEATLKNFNKVKSDINTLTFWILSSTFGIFGEYYRNLNNRPSSITTRMTNAKAVIDKTDTAVPDLGISEELKTTIRKKITEVETSLEESTRAENPVKNSNFFEQIYKGKNDVEKYIFYRALVHFGILNEEQYLVNILNNEKQYLPIPLNIHDITNENDGLLNPLMDKVAELLSKFSDNTSTEYTKLKEIFETFDSRSIDATNQINDSLPRNYNSLIERIKTKGGYNAVKALAANIQTAIKAAETKISKQ